MERISEMDNIVVSCGGGTVMRQCNVDGDEEEWNIVLLTAEPETIYEKSEKTATTDLFWKKI